jgi:AcrR family transcriptional regulator
VQPDTHIDGDRDGIIEAAYSCLSEPHSGPILVAAILARARVSTRAFYRHFDSKDGLFLALLQQETDALAGRLDRIADDHSTAPIEQLEHWVRQMFGLVNDPRLRMHMAVIDSDEVRAARGYRDIRERAHVHRERSLVRILQRGHDDGSFPLARPERDAVAVSAVVSRELTTSARGNPADLPAAIERVLDFSLRALGARPPR